MVDEVVEIVPVKNKKGDIELWDIYITFPYDIDFHYMDAPPKQLVERRPAGTRCWFGSKMTEANAREEAKKYLDISPKV